MAAVAAGAGATAVMTSQPAASSTTKTVVTSSRPSAAPIAPCAAQIRQTAGSCQAGVRPRSAARGGLSALNLASSSARRAAHGGASAEHSTLFFRYTAGATEVLEELMAKDMRTYIRQL